MVINCAIDTYPSRADQGKIRFSNDDGTNWEVVALAHNKQGRWTDDDNYELVMDYTQPSTIEELFIFTIKCELR